MPNDETAGQVKLNRARLVAVALTTGGVLIALIAVGWALARYIQLSQAVPPVASDFWDATVRLGAGVAAGLFLWGMAEILRKLESVHESQRSARPGAAAETTLYGMPFRTEAPYKAPEDLKAVLQELVALTREVRDVSLLSERDRGARMRIQGQALVRQFGTVVPALLQEHKWVEARQRIQRARERFPAFVEWDQFEKEIEGARAGVEARDVETVARQVDDLAALAAWERAMGLVAALLERHPNSVAAQELARRVNIQREKADAEQRARLMAQAQQAVSQREWNQALILANDVIRRFPRSPEADALRQQLPTLVENAEIQTRHQMEQEFRELLQQHRHPEALRLAREIITRYPSSPQAEILRQQLARLEEKAGPAAR